MKKRTGLAVSPGIAIGKTFLYEKKTQTSTETYEGCDTEKKKLEEAIEVAKQQLQDLQDKAKDTIGDEQAEIMEIQVMMLEDQDLLDAASAHIEAGMPAAAAITESGKEVAEQFRAMEGEYFRARAADILDASTRTARILRGESAEIELNEPVILFAEDLSPSETLQLPRENLLAFVTRGGSPTSHTAILARTLGIPAIVLATELTDDEEVAYAVIDGTEGTYFLNPDEQTKATYEEKLVEQNREKDALNAFRGKESVCRSGEKIKIFANIGNDAEAAMKGDAEGIGLLRSEFMYLGRDSAPTEEDLYEAYASVVKTMNGQKVVIRTIDIGADKQISYFDDPKEDNPALGYRGIRYYILHQEVFKPQIRAIYRAAALGTVSVMFPMITSVEEVVKLKEGCELVRQELITEGIACGEVEIGIMIETPAAAICTKQLAEYVDFFSVGTNDLTQYTLALDRQNAALSCYFDKHHPALLSLLEEVGRNAKEAGIWAGICGELAGDMELTESFIRWGYEELSVAPGYVLSLRKHVSEIDLHYNN